MKFIWSWVISIIFFSFLVLGFGSQLQAEGSWQMGLNEGATHEQPLFEYDNSYNNTDTGIEAKLRPLYVDIVNANEVINISLCAVNNDNDIRIEIYNETGTTQLNTTFTSTSGNVACDDDFTGTLSTPYQFTAPTVGTYQIRIFNDSGDNSNGVFKRFDVTVTPDASTAVNPRLDGGRLWAYRLGFRCTAGNACYGVNYATSADLYTVVDGGFNNSYYVWQLDLNDFAGYAYELVSNDLGLESPNPDGTVVAGLSGCIDTDDDPTNGCSSVSGNRNNVAPINKIYFSYPSLSYDRPTTLPEISDFRFLDEDGVDDSISPSDTLLVQDTGNFFFNTNLATTGTYTITIDIDQDGTFGLGDVFLNGPATPGENNVSWNGKDNSGNAIPNGSYQAQIVLKTGEFHFTAADAETSGGSGQGLTINAVLNDGTIDTSNKVYWDDATYLKLTNPESFNAEGTYKYHSWGNFTSGGDGNRAYIDTYSIGTTSVPVFVSLAIEPDDTPRTKIVGNIFDDVDGNGIQDLGEAGLGNVQVVFTETNSGRVFSVSTDSNGTYVAFTSATEPSITIDINESSLPEGFVQTAGTDPELFALTPNIENDVGDDGYQKQADLLTTKTANNATPYVGDTVIYTLRVVNNGAAEATNVSLTDLLPIGITYSGNTLTQGTYSSATGLWDIGTLANGADANLTLSGAVNSGTSSLTITNTTTAASGDEFDPTTGNDDLNESITVLNRDPIAVDDNYTVAEDTNVTLSPLTADSDPDGDVVSITSINGVNLTLGTAQTIAVTNGTVTVSIAGVIIFTPDTNYNGPVSFPYVITDGKGGTATASENITVNAVNDDPVVDTEIPNQSSEDGNTTSVDVGGNFSDPEGNTLTFSATGLPTGLTMSGAGVISGTIDNSASQGGTSGVYSVTVTANDGNGGTVTDTFTWTVTNPVPTATDNNNTTNEDTPVSGNVITDDDGNGVDSDPDGDTLSVTQFAVGGSTYTAGQTAVVTEGNLTITGTGAYTFTPAKNSTADMPQATYTLSDGEGGTDTATLDITVNAVNDVPVANPEINSTDEDTQLVVAAAAGVLSNDTDPDGDTPTVTEYNVGGNSVTVGNPLILTEGNLTIAADGSYIFDPAPDFNGPVPAVTYTISDGNGGEASSTLTITVDPVNDAPVAEDDSQSTPMNTPVAVPVLNNDHDPEDGDLIILDVNTTGTDGTVVWDENGTVIFTPDTDFIGITTFTYTIDDGNGGTDTATVTITVTDPTDPSNNAVTAVADSATTQLDTDVDIPVLINDYDPESDEFHLTSVVTQPLNGTATINDNGTVGDPSDDYITYEPNTGFVGNDTFEYEITDANGNRDIAIVTVSVVDSAADPLPNAVADAAITDQDTPVTIDVLDNDTHPNVGEDLNITGFTQPANGVVTLDDGGTPGNPNDDQLIYTPNPGFYGYDTFMYTITDSSGDTALAAVTVTVVEKGTVTGIVYEDLNGDGTQNSGELGLADANITITDSKGNIYNLTTDVNGSYSQIVPEGNVTIDIDESPYEAVIQTEGTNPTTLFVPSGGTVNDVDGYRAPLGTITVGTARPPSVDDDSVEGITGAATVIDVVGNDVPGTYPLDPTTVMIIDPVNGEVQSMTVPGEGVWSVDPISGEITFTPEAGFIGDPTPISYTVLDTSGASDGGTVTINYPPVANDDSNLSLEEGETAILDVLANDENTSYPFDPESVSLVAPLNATDILSDLDGDIIGFSIPGEGEWSVDETTGVVSFIPDAGLTDDPTPVNYTVRETNGDESNEAVLTVSYKRLILTLNAFCENDVPYINYDIQAVGFDATGETATLTWTSADGMSIQVENNLTLSNTHHLWAGAQVDSSGNGIVWPGWNELPDGTWEIVWSDWRRWNADQSDATLTVTLSVNPSSSVTVQYPPATSVCQPNPVPVDSVNPPPSSDAGLPYATDNLNIPITSYNPTVIDVLANGDAWGSNGPGNVAISFTQPTYGTVGIDDGGTPNDPTDDVLLYTPKADVNEVTDSFTYTITDAAGNTATARVTLDVNCASSQTSDSGDALGVISMLMLAIMTLMTGLYFVRKEEERGNI